LLYYLGIIGNTIWDHGSIRDKNNPLDWCVDTFGPGRTKSRWTYEYKDTQDDGFETTFKFTDEKDYIHFMLRWR